LGKFIFKEVFLKDQIILGIAFVSEFFKGLRVGKLFYIGVVVYVTCVEAGKLALSA
jgi:hypothetical protein